MEGEAFQFALNGNYLKNLTVGVNEYVSYLEPHLEDEAFLNAVPMVFSNNGKFTQTLGKAKNSQEAFDDADWLQGKFNFAVKEVKMWTCGSFVHGIQFSYAVDGTTKSPGKHCTEKGGLRCESLVLNENEHITRIMVRSGDWVDGITLFTDMGRSMHCGGMGGTPHIAVVPQGNQFIAVGGSTMSYLEEVRFFYDEVY